MSGSGHRAVAVGTEASDGDDKGTESLGVDGPGDIGTTVSNDVSDKGGDIWNVDSACPKFVCKNLLLVHSGFAYADDEKEGFMSSSGDKGAFMPVGNLCVIVRAEGLMEDEGSDGR